MHAQLDTVHGAPVLRLEASLRGLGYGSSKRAVVDVPLTPEQAKLIDINMLGFTR